MPESSEVTPVIKLTSSHMTLRIAIQIQNNLLPCISNHLPHHHKNNKTVRYIYMFHMIITAVNHIYIIHMIMTETELSYSMQLDHKVLYSIHKTITSLASFSCQKQFGLPSVSTPRTIRSIRPAFSGNTRRTWDKIAIRSITTLTFLRPNRKNC